MSTTVKERPILFSGPMVRAILDGSKTQTRRVVKPQPPEREAWERVPKLLNTSEGLACKFSSVFKYGAGSGGTPEDHNAAVWVKSPYGQAGDRLWVRESHIVYGMWIPVVGNPDKKWTFIPHTSKPVLFEGQADDVQVLTKKAPVLGYYSRPSIFLFEWMARIHLEITDVRVQRLQDISEEDAKSEGVPKDSSGRHYLALKPGGFDYDASPKNAFKALWDSINGKREGCNWEANPWVWAVSFKRVKP